MSIRRHYVQYIPSGAGALTVTVATGQGQSVAAVAVALSPIDATVATAQGAQSAAATARVVVPELNEYASVGGGALPYHRDWPVDDEPANDEDAELLAVVVAITLSGCLDESRRLP